MKFAVGYQLSENFEQDFIKIIEKYKDSISEVYFPWLDTASGRGSLVDNNGYFDWSVQEKLVSDLRKIKSMGIKTDLLFNGNCYGAEALSISLENRISSIIDYLNESEISVDIITTTSPAIAFTIKKNYKSIEVRASVNMRIGTIKGMQYLEDLFDSFYIQRDYNRDFVRIKELKFWCDKNEKKLLLLANSGCMSFCSCQTFHDNMVSHNSEIENRKNMPDFMPHSCWNHLKNQKNWSTLLQNTWIRPEDLGNYDEYFDVVKLATRMHRLPAMVIDSYVKRRYYGNLLDLFEPGFGPAIAPYVIDNSRFPAEWFNKASSCRKNCHECNYCSETLEVIVRAE